MCLLRVPHSPKLLPHRTHENGFSPVCVLKCRLRVPHSLKLLPHWEQENGFSPVCVLECLFKVPHSPKLFPHCWHVNGFSPVWVLTCRFSVPQSIKLFPHWEHGNGFSPVCVLICRFRVPHSPKLLPHWVQENGFSPECVLMCLLRVPHSPKLFPHWLHEVCIMTQAGLELWDLYKQYSRNYEMRKYITFHWASTSNTVLNPSTTYYKHMSTVHTQIWPLSLSEGKFHNLSQVSLHSACNNTIWLRTFSFWISSSYVRTAIIFAMVCSKMGLPCCFTHVCIRALFYLTTVTSHIQSAHLTKLLTCNEHSVS